MTTLVRAIAALGLVFVTRLLRGPRNREEVVLEPAVQTAVEHPWLTAGAMVMAVVALAGLVVISGVVPIKASSGHWAITAAVLDFAKTRSVSTHSLGIDAPSLHDEALILRGAGHYETACRPCHGGPGHSTPPVMRAMTPKPPHLDERISRWEPEELFSIVKHGIKFTGMPAWPVQQRDDEVWAMVAFLRRMPKLDAAAYRRLAYGALDAAGAASDLPRAGEEPPPPAVRDVCWRCHGVSGTGRGPGAFPSLAGQRSEYLVASLRAYRDGRRLSAMMAEVAAKLDDTAMGDVAAYYEALPFRQAEPPDDAASIERGRTIATQGILQRDVPACVECHGPTTFPKNRAYPRLTAQHAGYLVSQLILLQERRRGGTPNVDLMHAFVNGLRQNDIRDVAAYYASVPASPDPSGLARPVHSGRKALRVE